MSPNPVHGRSPGSEQADLQAITESITQAFKGLPNALILYNRKAYLSEQVKHELSWTFEHVFIKKVKDTLKQLYKNANDHGLYKICDVYRNLYDDTASNLVVHGQITESKGYAFSIDLFSFALTLLKEKEVNPANISTSKNILYNIFHSEQNSWSSDDNFSVNSSGEVFLTGSRADITKILRHKQSRAKEIWIWYYVSTVIEDHNCAGIVNSVDYLESANGKDNREQWKKYLSDLESQLCDSREERDTKAILFHYKLQGLIFDIAHYCDTCERELLKDCVDEIHSILSDSAIPNNLRSLATYVRLEEANFSLLVKNCNRAVSILDFEDGRTNKLYEKLSSILKKLERPDVAALVEKLKELLTQLASERKTNQDLNPTQLASERKTKQDLNHQLETRRRLVWGLSVLITFLGGALLFFAPRFLSPPPPNPTPTQLTVQPTQNPMYPPASGTTQSPTDTMVVIPNSPTPTFSSPVAPTLSPIVTPNPTVIPPPPPPKPMAVEAKVEIDGLNLRMWPNDERSVGDPISKGKRVKVTGWAFCTKQGAGRYWYRIELENQNGTHKPSSYWVVGVVGVSDEKNTLKTVDSNEIPVPTESDASTEACIHEP